MNLTKINEVTEPAAKVQIDDAANKAHLVPIATRKSSRRRKLPFFRSIAMQSLFFSPSPPAVHRRAGKSLVLKHVNPNIYVIENFLSNTEIYHLDSIYVTPKFSKFSRSYTDDGSVDGVKNYNENRTSTFMWLEKASDPVLRKIERRASEIVGLPAYNVEPLQIVAYKDGQEFKTHHDMGKILPGGDIEAGEPRRLVTFFVYLNTLPIGEGHTEFPSLKGLSMTPKQGMAVLFPNILSNGAPDKMTVHKANPVHKPYVKIGMNIWYVILARKHNKCKLLSPQKRLFNN